MAAYYPDETSAAGGNRKYTGQQKDPKKVRNITHTHIWGLNSFVAFGTTCIRSHG